MRIVLAALADRVDDPLVQALFESVRVETNPEPSPVAELVTEPLEAAFD